MKFRIVILILLSAFLVSCSNADKKYKDIYEAIGIGDTQAVKDFVKKNPGIVNSKERHIEKEGDTDIQFTPLLYALFKERQDIALFLIEKGADINAADNVGTVPLHRAALLGYFNIVELLISKGADVNVKNSGLDTPLHFAAMKSRKTVVLLLIQKGAKVDVKDCMGATPLQYAQTKAEKGDKIDEEIVGILKEHEKKK